MGRVNFTGLTNHPSSSTDSVEDHVDLSNILGMVTRMIFGSNCYQVNTPSNARGKLGKDEKA